MPAVKTAAEAAPQPPSSSVPSFLSPATLYQRGVQTYRVTITYVARAWTPPPVFDGVESASFVFLLSTALFVMEGFHAARYTLRQLRRFKTETRLRHITLLGGRGTVVAPAEKAATQEHEPAAGVDTKSRETLGESEDVVEGDDDGDDETAGAAGTAVPAWYQRIVQLVASALPARAATAGDRHSDGGSDGEDAAAASTSHPLHLLGNEESEYDFMSRDVSVPFEMSNLPTQRGVSQVSYVTTDGAPSMGVHEEVDHEDEDEEDQTWEATPEMLMHYWKQLQRTILSAPRRNPRRFFRSLPDEMKNYEPDTHVVNAWFDDITRHLHEGSSLWSWLSSGASLEAEEGEGTAAGGTTATPTSRGPGWQQRLTFTVPPNGCFAYHTRPPPEDFYPDTEEDSEEDEEEGEASGEEETAEQGGDQGSAAATAQGKASATGTDVEVSAPTTGRTAEGEADSTTAATTATDASAHPPRRHALRWEAMLLIWFNVAEVPMSSREIRALLLKASPPAFMNPAMVRDDGPTDFDVASANLSILWFWSTLQRVFETLVVNEDVEKCEDDIKELQSYEMPLFMKCVARWPPPSQMGETSELAFHRGLVCFICVVQSTWITLRAVLHKLLSLRRRLYYRNTWSLVRYMYSSSKAKMMSAALITVMMTISSRVSAAGRVVRERIASYVESAGEDGAVVESNGVKMNLRLMLGLCAFELTRMAVQYVISNTTSEFIVLTASQRREVVKMQLYEALSHTQLTFYEQHTYEEVEEIIYYVSDMEGIDVQLHQYLFNAINVFMELKDALQPFTYRSMVVAAGVAMAPYALRSIATMVEQRYLLAQREGYLPSGAYAVEDEYQGEDDDSNVLREGAMLRGDEIIAAIPQLRPYGADVRLVRWWNRHQQRRQHIELSHHQRASTAKEVASLKSSPRSARVPVTAGRRSASSARNADGRSAVQPRQSWGEYAQSFFDGWVTDEDIGLVRSALVALVQLPHGKLLPGSGKALLDLSEWLLPMAASAYGIHWCGQPNLDPFQLVQGMQAIEAAVDSVSEAMDTAEMVGFNAYKASMLERLLQPTQWEVIAQEEEPYMANFTISAAGVGHANDARQCCIEQSHLTAKTLPLRQQQPPRPSTVPLTVGPARAASFYRRRVLRHIEVQNIRLRCAPVEATERRRRRRQRGHVGRSTTAAAAAAAAASGSSLSSGSAQSGGEGGAATTTAAALADRRPPAAVAAATTTDDDDDDEMDEMEELCRDGAPLFSADIVLWSPPQQRGRFVCVTGPNGGGKTALVNLLLALYVNNVGPLSASAASSPHAGGLGSGSVTFCFAHGTHSRRHRRGGLTGRTANTASSSNVARTSRSVADSARRGRPITGGRTVSAANTGRSVVASAGRGPYGAATDRVADGVEARVDIRTIPADVLRRHIFSYVPEMPTIFAGATVAQNISLAGYVSVATDSLMRRVTQCAELAQCDFVQRLPLGLLTRISDSTANSWNTAGQYSTGAGNTSVTRLSADQAKRLMLARAYFHGGEVLLLDEPTKEIEDAGTAQRMCDGWRRLLERGYCGGVICMTMDETLLKMADEVITLP